MFIFGILEGLSFRSDPPTQLRQLNFPLGYPVTTKDRYEPSTAIRQFSTGRSSVLGLSDDGKVWSWTGETSDSGVSVKSFHVDMIEHQVLEVQAGWDRSSMYVKDVGLVYWSDDSDSGLVQGRQQQALAFADTIMIDTVTIPGTSYRQKRNRRNSFPNESLEVRIGEVTHYVVLEAHIVFTTHRNKIFSYATRFPLPEESRTEPVELTTFYLHSPGSFQIRDLQGSFSNFAVFAEGGAVLIGTRSLLDTFHNRAAEETEPVPEGPFPQPSQFPSLQINSVISIAFGDHHLHALHTNGTITSLGKELQHCGALGLGSYHQAPFRGVLSSRQRWGDGYLRHETTTRRTIWFEHWMQRWLTHLIHKSNFDGSEAKPRVDLITGGNEAAREAMGEWFEQEGRKWEHGLNSSSDQSEMGAYFVLKVAAAGWHSAALVLVDEEKAERARKMHVSRPEHDGIAEEEEKEEHVKGQKSGPSSLASNETIDSPSEQLANAVYDFFNWVRDLGRRFLGLKRRDELGEAAAAAARPGPGEVVAGGITAADSDVDGEVLAEGYTWDEDVLPRLRMRDGTVMPGTGDVIG